MRILFIGDIVGGSGRRALRQQLPLLRQQYRPDFVLVNGENAAAGKGITRAIAHELFESGVHGITMGNHTWDQKETAQWIEEEARIVRPANYPPNTPGQGVMTLRHMGKTLVVMNVLGRTFMSPVDCPFRTVDALLEGGPPAVPVLLDVHAETTSEKLALGWYVDGRVAAVVGTHTHVQTHDEQIFPQGTAYVTDVGMTGSYEGILGMERTAVMRRFVTQMPARFVADEGRYHLHAVVIEIDDDTRKAKGISLIRIREGEFRMH